MADRHCQGIRRVIGTGCFPKSEQCLDHELNLLFRRAPRPNDRTLHFSRRVLTHGATALNSGQERHTTGLPHQHCAARVLPIEAALDGDVGWSMVSDEV